MNKNLHCTTALTEFARDFDEEDTIMKKFVDKLTFVYNSVNSAPSSSTRPAESASTSSQASTPVKSPSKSSVPEVSEKENISNSPSTTSLNSKNSGEPSTESSGASKAEASQETTKSTQPDEFPDVSQGRTPLNVVRRISNLITLRNNDLNDYRNTDLQKFWIPDANAKECYECSAKFTTFKRKHHCRLCGCIFCNKCCNQLVPGKIIKVTGDLKVCTYCSKVVLTYLKSSDITADLKSDLQALEDDLSNKFVSSPSTSSNLVSDSGSPQRKISVGYQEERLVTNPNVLSNIDRRNILQQSNSLKQLHEDMLASLQDRCKGNDLIAFLISNQKSSNKIQAQAILNAMVEAGFIQLVSYYDGSSPGQMITNPQIPLQNLEFNENEFYEIQKLEEVVVSPDKNPRKMSSIQESQPREDHRDEELQNSLNATGSRALLEAYCEHEEALLGQLLRNNNLDLSWSKVLIPLCSRISLLLHPKFCRSDSMDIRNFVNIKKVSGGSRVECAIIGGTVCSKNVAHKNMKTRIEHPKILLLQCAIAYHRVEGKFVSIETLLLQEKEYLRNVISRILHLKPDVVLVHKNVAGIAQDMLRDHGVTLVLDVKLSVLERLARCFQCDIVTSIDSNIGAPKLGTCDIFYTKNFEVAEGVKKTLMFFEYPFNQRGCTLLLRGGTEFELAKVKKVASFLLFARYNFRLELSYLLDEFAKPPSPKPSIFDSKEQSPMDARKVEKFSQKLDEKLEVIPEREGEKGKEKERECEKSEIKKESEKEREKTREKDVEREKKDEKEEKKCEKEKIIHVSDFSDPLRSALSPSVFGPDVEFAVQNLFDNKFRTSLSATILSTSPFISFPLPYLESEQGRKCFLRSYFPNELYYSKQWSDNSEKPLISVDHQQSLVDENEEVQPPHEFLQMKITTPADSKDYQTALANFRRNGGRFPYGVSVIKESKKQVEFHSQRSMEEFVYKDALDVANHQRLPVLFCSYYYNTKELPASFCTQPLLLNMHFYGQDDIMLGLFLERYCFRSSYICPSCKLPMMDHIRRYAHSMGCIQVKLDEDPNKPAGNSIMIFSRCQICGEQTPSIPMSNETWCLSFAKYLELKFHGHSYKRRYIDDGSTQGEKRCTHSLHKDHVQYFSSNGVIVSFQYTPVEIWEIKLPVAVLSLKPPQLVDNKFYVEKIKSLAQKGYEIYAKIHEKLANLASDVETPVLLNLKRALNSDQLNFKCKVETVQILLSESVVYSDEITETFLLARKELADSIELWGPRLNAATSKLQLQGKLETQVSVEAAMICTEDLVGGEENPTHLETIGEGEVPEEAGTDQKIVKEQKVDKTTLRKLLATLLPSSSTDTNIFPSPFSSNEHYCLPNGWFPVLVNDQDLSSIISYTLVSHEYQKQLDVLCNVKLGTNVAGENSSPSLKRKTTGEMNVDPEDREVPSPKESVDKVDKARKSTSSPHIEVNFSDLTTNFTCKVYFAKEFDEMRANFLKVPKYKNDGEFSNRNRSVQDEKIVESQDIQKHFARALCESCKWEARGGKSGSTFSKTADERFVLKEMSKLERDIAEFEKFAPNYFNYVNQCLTKNLPTLLAKIYGVYKVTIKKKDCEKVEKSFLVIENLFCDKKITHKYDLKGSERNRLVDPTLQTGDTVLLDENLIKTSWSKPLYILTHSRTILREAINRDSTFLEKNDVMDYSLLVGLDSEENFLIVGIIDYIKKYTIDKKIESYVKQALDQSKLPTIVSPSLYKTRFSEAMDRYFLAVPDRWEGLSKK